MLNGRWPHSWCEIGTLIGAFNQEKVLVGPSPRLWNIHEPLDNLRLKLYTNCHLHSCLRLWCGREERIWRSHEYEYEESRFRQTSLTGLDQDRQLAHSHLRYNTDFFLRCLSATAATCSHAPARPLLPCHETQCSIRSLTSGWTPCWCRGPRHRGHLQ